MHKLGLFYPVNGKQFNVSIIRVEKKQKNIQTLASPVFATMFHINTHYPSDYADNKADIIKGELQNNYTILKQFIGAFK